MLYGRGDLRQASSAVGRAGGEKTILHMNIQDVLLSIHCPAIVDEQTWRQVQVRLSEGRAVFGGNPERRHLLGGLLRCPICGRGMQGSKRDKPTRNGNVTHEHLYRCPDSRASRNPGKVVCNKKAYHAHDAEPVVIKGIVDVSGRSELVTSALAAYRQKESAGFDPQEPGRIETALRALDAKEQATIAAQVAGIQAGANPAAYASAFAKIADERTALTARLRTAETRRGESAGPGSEDEAKLLAQALWEVRDALDPCCS